MHEKVLLVDTNEDTLEAMEFFLTKSGYNVFLAHTASEAIYKIGREKTFLLDFIVMDLMIPFFRDGLELIEFLEKFFPQTKILVTITGKNGEQFCQEKNLIFFWKPLTKINQLLAQIKNCSTEKQNSSLFC